MTQVRILLTSFQPWLAYQRSNSSDDLLGIIQSQSISLEGFIFFKKLIVETHAASKATITAIKQYQPDYVVCCGMAESRDRLTVEYQACCGDEQYQTTVNLENLIQDLTFTEISYEAGKYVCEGLYFHVLKYLNQFAQNTQAIFVHIPILSVKNEPLILQDFNQILTRLINHKPA